MFLGAGVITREATLPAGALATALDGTIRLIGRTLQPVAGIEPGESFQPEQILDEAQPDVLVIPGGFGCRPMAEDDSLVSRLLHVVEGAAATLAISTGVLLLAATGGLHGARVAGHWLTPDELARYEVELTDEPALRRGRLFTASGAASAVETVPLMVDVIRYGPD